MYYVSISDVILLCFVCMCVQSSEYQPGLNPSEPKLLHDKWKFFNIGASGGPITLSSENQKTIILEMDDEYDKTLQYCSHYQNIADIAITKIKDNSINPLHYNMVI